MSVSDLLDMKTMTWLTLSRALQGAGAGGIVSSVWTITSEIVSPKSRSKWSQALSLTWSSSAIAGPLLGGLFSGAGVSSTNICYLVTRSTDLACTGHQSSTVAVSWRWACMYLHTAFLDCSQYSLSFAFASLHERSHRSYRRLDPSHVSTFHKK
jgi:MFS family permease